MHLPTTQGAPFKGNCGLRQQQIAVVAFRGLVIMMRSLSYESAGWIRLRLAMQIGDRREGSIVVEESHTQPNVVRPAQAPLHTDLTERLAWHLRWIGRESVRGQQHERQRVGSEAVTKSAGVCIDACIHSYLATRRAMCQETETERMRFHRQTRPVVPRPKCRWRLAFCSSFDPLPVRSFLNAKLQLTRITS